jgi:hypothetical protein
MAPTIRGLRCRVGHLFQSNDQDIIDERHRLVSHCVLWDVRLLI